ncbi:MAG: Repressor protein [Rhodospirillales bacterium]|nr:Repressor protein [Rhodospirillales bacterium]
MDSYWFVSRLNFVRKVQKDLADALGLDVSAVNRLIHGNRKIKAEELPTIAKFLDVSVETLMERIKHPSEPISEQDLEALSRRQQKLASQRPLPLTKVGEERLYGRGATTRFNHEKGSTAEQSEQIGPPESAWLTTPKDLPILGTVSAAPEVLTFPSDQRPYGMTYRPFQLLGVPDVFATICSGEAMRPMYKPGQVLYLNPHEPVRPGDGVLIERKDETAVVREMRAARLDEVEVARYQPEERIEAIPRTMIRRLYRVMGALDLR